MKKGDEMQTIVYSGIFAGLMAIFVTVAIEKWGGVKGGILGTLPITIVPAAIGIYAVDPFSFSKSMLVVPLGMLLNGATLCIWVILPPYLPKTGKSRLNKIDKKTIRNRTAQKVAPRSPQERPRGLDGRSAGLVWLLAGPSGTP